jgi:competence protein CoiA
MRFALHNSQRIEAQRGIAAMCPCCGGAVIAHCGEVYADHWAHASKRECDPWHEPETLWHRSWKNQFPIDWQEIVHPAPDAQRHIADVKTTRGWVLEFQHSPIKADERRARDAFYPLLIWIIDGTRRKTDAGNLFEAWQVGRSYFPQAPHLRRIQAHENRLLREWGGCRAPVIVDVGADQPLLWLIPCNAAGIAYLTPMARAQIIEWARGESSAEFPDLEKQWTTVPANLAQFEIQLEEIRANEQRRSNLPPAGFARYLASKRARRPRF